jgi:large subunit ribosomal protein L23
MTADITDIKAIIYTDKTFSLQENNVYTVKTSKRVTKNSLKEVFKKYFDVTPVRVNSLNQKGKVKRFRGRTGKQADFKKFYVWVPEGAKIQGLEV